jgi:predicted CXXCH cytochrome family protein
MKRLLFLGLGSALVFTMGGIGTAQADNGPHLSSASLGSATVTISQAGAGKCASCHRAHTAKAGFLLLQAQPALCYTCHDGTSASTAVDTGVNAATGLALRGGGFSNAAIGSGLATKDLGVADPVTGRIATTNQIIPALATAAATTSKHLIDGTSAGTAWGNGPISATANAGKSLTLECGSCHDPHGNGNFRILKPMPTDSQWVVTPAVVGVPAVLAADGVTVITPAVVAVPAVMSPATNINIPDATTKTYTTANYWLAGDATVPQNTAAQITAGNTPFRGTAGVGADGYIQNVSAWCTTCHTRYLAASGSYKTANAGYDKVTGANLLTGATDATFMYRHRSDANTKAGAANCITCHVSHGSNAKMAGAASLVTNPDGTTTTTAADSRLLRVDNRGACLMCHNV